MSDKQRLSAAQIARAALVASGCMDQRAYAACDTAERFANGLATREELEAARTLAWRAAAFAYTRAQNLAAKAAAATTADDVVMASAGAITWAAESAQYC